MMEKANQMFGDKVGTSIENDVEHVMSNCIDEETMRKEIQEKIGATMPSFFIYQMEQN